MDSIRIRNLRSLTDTGDIQIKPLTILVGKNSSGKSTFLRFFPLMKQTLSIKKNEPILWYSKENVDFGSFDESINKNSDEKTIGFDFKFKIPENQGYENSKRNVFYSNTTLDFKIDFEQRSVNKISITLNNDDKIVFSKGKKYSLTINDKSIQEKFTVINPDVFGNFTPRFVIDTKIKDSINEERSVKRLLTHYFATKICEMINREDNNTSQEIDSNLLLEVIKFIKDLKPDDLINLKKRNLDRFLDFEDDFVDRAQGEGKIRSKNLEEFLYNEQIIISNTRTNKRLLNFLTNCNDEEYSWAYINILGAYSDKILMICNSYINNYFSNVHYIAPLRASAQRYYRLQGLAVDEIDPQGENIPMAINHLNSRDKKNFKEWMLQNFGFEIDTKFKEGHVTLNITFEDNQSLNLADTGFGFSQVLPIILLLWRIESNYSTSKRNNRLNYNNQHNIVIEQPELHLHPALQARLTDALVNCIKKAKQDEVELNIILETHSETIINRVGQLIYKEKISNDLVNVLIFGGTEKNKNTESCITSVSYNEDGIVEDWPLGFFYPEV